MSPKASLTALAALLSASALHAQSDVSLFRRADSLQVSEIVSERPVLYSFVGHHGPAVENMYYALRLHFNDSGAIDLYSKAVPGLELARYHWYPDEGQRRAAGEPVLGTAESGETGIDGTAAVPGEDIYDVGGTLGFGGAGLWDGHAVRRLEATGGRTARVGKTRKGAFCEIIACGVPFGGALTDVSIRIDVDDRKRDAVITLASLDGKELPFVTGLACSPEDKVVENRRYTAVWQETYDPETDMKQATGTAMKIRPSKVLSSGRDGNMIYFVFKPAVSVNYVISACSSKESGLDTLDKFTAFLGKLF